ncbi:MAG: type II toxin-antitoxin system CcdA family antitoxin [Proteobacteria bacterium]|nr:type II toxin-antitoxin system CcdA family antitoxin [Pseudomonadota bacterium]
MKKHVAEPAKPFRPKGNDLVPHIGGKRSPARKRAVNVSLDTEILDEAKRMKLNLSRTLEDALRGLVQEERNARWRRENRATIESYNRLIEKAGVFGEEFQEWGDESVSD